MKQENNNEILNNNNSNDLFENFKKENSDIDDLLNDAFSFMEVAEDVEDDEEAVYGEDFYNNSAEDTVYDETTAGYEEEALTPEEMKAEKKKKITYSILIAVLSVCIIAIVAVMIKFGGIFGDIYDPGDATPTKEGETLAEEEDFDTMFGVTDAASLNDALKQWSTNRGEIMSSKNVINILLIGQDGSATEKTNGLADSLIIASVNKATKTITLASIMRDSYTYFNVDGRDRYNKINASCVYGGPKGVIETIENNYKIAIDYYASVNFASFKDVINALGGIEVPIEPGLAAYINRTTRYHVSSGDAVHLNGDEALVYARIRKYYSDSDVSRTANQRRVINAIMQKAKGASVTQLYNVVEAVLPYMKTNMRQSKILSYGKQALSEGWINYTMQQETFPTVDTRGSANISPAGSCWVVDYPLAAQHMQKLLYGKTNIVLSPNRVNVLNSYLTYKPEYTGPSTMTPSGITGGYTTDGTTAGWTGEGTTVWTGESTTGSESTTSWWQGVIGGGNNNQTTTEPPVVTDPVTDAPVTTPPATETPTSDQGANLPIPTP